jgi:hypothetical protein
MFQNPKIKAVLAFSLSFLKMQSQIPGEVPHPNNNLPIDIHKPEDVIIYIVLPIIFVILFFLGRKYPKNNN